jgi:hypothetical protein
MKSKKILCIVFFFSSWHAFSQDIVYQPAEKYLNQIIVEKSNFNFKNDKEYNKKGEYIKFDSWDKFPSNFDMFDSISREKHENNWIKFRDKLNELSKNKNLDYVSLAKCLELIKEGNKEIDLLPIAAYQCKNGKHNVWIIECRWEYNDLIVDIEGKRIYGGYGHIREYAIDVKNFKIIAFFTCI